MVNDGSGEILLAGSGRNADDNLISIASMKPASRTLSLAVQHVTRPVLVVIAVCVVAAAIMFRATGRSPAEVRFPTPSPNFSLKPSMVGTPMGGSGCLASACHGAPAEQTLAGQFTRQTWMTSGSCWVATDPHGGAYDLLTENPRRAVRVTASEIATRLGLTTRAEDDNRCLACHTNPTLAVPGIVTEDRVRTLRREGVACEACHGNAGGWLREHTVPGGTPSTLALGMLPLTDAHDRAQTCTGCHVGSPAIPELGIPVRDLTHDMIAAGHPRLNFDYAESLRRLPKHWWEKTAPQPASEWLIGRIVHARAACRLLADRAERAVNKEPRSPWPEFAEFNCAACHHDLTERSARDPRSEGNLKWQTLWPVSAVPEAGASYIQPVLRELRDRRLLFAERIIAPARRAADELEGFRKSLASLQDEELSHRIRRMFPLSASQTHDKDELGQILLGLSALERANRAVHIDPAFDSAFEQYRSRDWAGFRSSLDHLLSRLRR